MRRMSIIVIIQLLLGVVVFSMPFKDSGIEFRSGILQVRTASGYRNRTSAAVSSMVSNGNYWCAAPNSSVSSRNLNFNSGRLWPLNANNRSNGFSVRSLQVSYCARYFLKMLSMKKYSFEEIYELLFEGYLSARKNIRSHIKALEFETNLEEYIYKDAKALFDRTYKPYQTECFMTKDPTLREIFAPSMHDAAQSHILYDNLHPLFDKTFIFDSYSCYEGKGVLFGINRFEHFLRSATENYSKTAYVLSLDIVGYFTHINKGVLYQLICENFERFKHQPIDKYSSVLLSDVIDFDFMDYLERVELFNNPLDNCITVGDKSLFLKYPPHKSLFNAPLGTGITIGRVTNCMNANIYLNPFDQWSKRIMKAKYYCRFADDIRIISTDRDYLEAYKVEAAQFLKERLRLTLHPQKTIIQSTNEPIQFLGAVYRPFRRYCSNKSINRFKQAIRQAERDYKAGEYNINSMLSSLNSHLGRMRHFSEYKTTRDSLESSPLNEIFDFPDYKKATIKKNKTYYKL